MSAICDCRAAKRSTVISLDISVCYAGCEHFDFEAYTPKMAARWQRSQQSNETGLSKIMIRSYVKHNAMIQITQEATDWFLTLA